MRIAALAVARRFNADHSDYAGPWLPCPCCKGQARYAGRRSKTFTSALGDLNLERAYYHCDLCDRGFFPRDRALGLEGGSFSPHALRMIGLVGCRVSFEEGSGFLHELAGINVPTKQVEREAERLGREIAEDERRTVESETDREIPPTLYLGMDGTGIPMRKSETEGRAGKQEDGSAKTREVKLVTIWSAEGRDQEGVPIRDHGSITYSAAIESAATSRSPRAARFSATALSGSGTSLPSTFPTPFRSSTVSTPTSISPTLPKRSTAPTAIFTSSGPTCVARNSRPARSTMSWLPSLFTHPAKGSVIAASTSARTGTGCATASSMPPASAPLPPSWSPAASGPSACA
jgi:hypothetical protein